MLTSLHRIFSRFSQNSRQVNNEPLNKVSLIVIILIDLFILFNTFQGLNEIAQWPMSPSTAHPCHSEWQRYRQDKPDSRDINILRNALEPQLYSPPLGSDAATTLEQQFRQSNAIHLGQVAETCLNYAALHDQIATSSAKSFQEQINQKQSQIQQLESSNAQIRSQYDSTLLEEIAGQSSERSINAVAASQAKQTLADNDSKISALKQETKALEQQILGQPESVAFLDFLQDDQQWQPLETSYRRSQFWHPTIQLGMQTAFLLPLMALAFWIHRTCQRRGYGLAALISWHLLVVFFVPFVFKVFELLQFGAVFAAIADIVWELAQGLIFLVRYAAILTIPLVGFGLIRFFQRFVFNPKIQAANRVQKNRCIRCAKRLGPHDDHCPHCGYHQLTDCLSCHEPTYKHLPYCKQCGAAQAPPS